MLSAPQLECVVLHPGASKVLGLDLCDKWERMGDVMSCCWGLPISRGRAGRGQFVQQPSGLAWTCPHQETIGLLFALTFSCLCLARIVAAHAASASSPSDKSWVEGMAERSKRQGVFEEETHDICVPVGRSFQKTPVSCEWLSS